MHVQFLDRLVVVPTARYCWYRAVSLATYSIVPRSVRMTRKLSPKMRAAMNFDLDERPDCS